ncbi:MAG: HAD family hydrolase [Oscillospiraceae bacterium]|nr:HAD family hydrolase [Oscillospiraceae bacterium]
MHKKTARKEELSELFFMDGTLLDDKKRLPAENAAALQAARDAGIVLVPATGRILKALPEGFADPNLYQYCIFANGAEIFNLQKEKRLFGAGIEPRLAAEVCRYMDGLPVLYDCYRGESGYMTAWMYEKAPEYFESEPEILKLVKKLRKPVPDLRENILETDLPVEKLQMYFRPEDLSERERQLKALPERFPELKASSSLKNNIEINSVHAGKGKALQELCRQLSIRIDESAAFGDGLNDIEMLQAAGIGCAMANAVDAVKRCADRITESNNEAGVGKEIFRMLSS